MFHGPVFQSVSEILAWDDTGIDVRLSEVSLADFFAPGHTPRLVLNPVLLDALSRVAPCWLVQYVGPEFHSFPSHIDRIELYEPCPADREGIVVRGRQRPPMASAPTSTRRATGSSTASTARAACCCVAARWATCSSPCPRPTTWRASTRCRGFLGAPAEPVAVQGVSLWQVPLIPTELATQSGGICMRVLAHVLLSEEERGEWRPVAGFAAPAPRMAVRPRRAGRKQCGTGSTRAPGRWCTRPTWWCATTKMARPSSTAGGTARWSMRPGRLSHSGEACLAAVAEPGLAVGVDF